MTSPHAQGKPARVSIFGLGYVGSVMAACLARLGHEVVGIDINPAKAEALNQGGSLIVEPGLEQITAAEHSAGKLRGTTDPTEAVRQSDLSFVCVGTPSLRAGRLGLQSIERVCEELGAALATKDGWHTVAIRSTVLPGTIESVVIPILEREAGKRADVDFGVCANPEFIREGSAVRDFFLPAFTVMGTREARSLGALRQIYGSLPGMVFETSIQTAEMVKYACNAFHALKIDFANEIASFARELGVDPNEVMDIVCADTKLNISRAYLRPGFAFGGSCLPKDVGALVHCARQHDLALPLLEALLPSNHAHINRAYESLLACGRKKVGFLGLSFKAGTDDLRESPALLLIKRLIGEGYVVRAYDRSISKSRIYGENKRFAETEIPHLFSILRPTMEEVVRESEVIVIANNDEEYSRTSTLLNPEQRIIDLVGLHRSSQPTTTLVPQQPATYQVRQQTA